MPLTRVTQQQKGPIMGCTFEIRDGVAQLQLDDGKVNVMSTPMLNAISEGLKQAAAAKMPALLTGRPGIFSAGFDMGTFARGIDPSREMVQAGIDLILQILSQPYPVMTMCTGHAFPMGAFLMLSADIRFGLDGDFRIGMNETAININMPDFALALAEERLTPAGRAGIPTARLFSPREAQSAGYLDHVGTEEEMQDALSATLSGFGKLNLEYFASAKKRLNEKLIRKVRGVGLPSATQI